MKNERDYLDCGFRQELEEKEAFIDKLLKNSKKRTMGDPQRADLLLRVEKLSEEIAPLYDHMYAVIDNRRREEQEEEDFNPYTYENGYRD